MSTFMSNDADGISYPEPVLVIAGRIVKNEHTAGNINRHTCLLLCSRLYNSKHCVVGSATVNILCSRLYNSKHCV